jgi:hypothetical protein
VDCIGVKIGQEHGPIVKVIFTGAENPAIVDLSIERLDTL